MSKKNQLFFGTQILSDSTPREGGSDYWRSLFYLNIYRMLLAVFLVTASLASFSVGNLGSRLPDLFFYTSCTYALLSLLFAVSIRSGWPQYITQCRIQILTDILFAIILYHTSSGRGAGLEILLFISVSASGILLGGRAALAVASAATILLILEHFYVIVTNQRSLGGFTTLGFVGGGLFVTAFIIYYLSLLLRKSEVEVAQQSRDIEKLSHINDLIVEQLDSGVIVIDQSLQPVLINQSGRRLLGITEASALPTALDGLIPAISMDTHGSSENKTISIESRITLPSGKKLLTRYKPLGDSFDNGYIILLDDFSQIEQEQRNEKFISMGRLSASIAHEIRNPLGAISHAGQLLAESPAIVNHDSRLVEIIETQSQRINQVIKTILDLGQPEEVNVEKIPLRDWLRGIIETVITQNHLLEDAVLLHCPLDRYVCGDPKQLQHVILNLLENSLRYAKVDDRPFIMVSVGNDQREGLIAINITDNGPGIAEDIVDKVFEPFFTTSATGNGLGLYIARKISLSNHGFLDYLHQEDGKGFFKLSLPSEEMCQDISGQTLHTKNQG